MTSPDFQTPAGALSPAAMSWLQDMLAKPIGKEGTQILQALASIGDSMLARFFKGYTDIADVFSHAFDELGAELSGIPGMSGVKAWADDIEELLSNALGLVDNVFTGVTDIVDGLAYAVTGRSVEGNIAEGMHMVVQGLTVFLELVNAAADMLTELLDGVLGVAGGTMHQLVQVLSWVIDIANQFLLFFNGIYDVFKGLFGWSTGGPNDRPLEKLFDAIPNLLTAFSPLNAAKLVGEIPGALLQGVQDAIDGVSDFLQDLVNAILRAIRGIPVVGGTLADIVAEVGGLQQKAVEAQSDASAAQSTATAVQNTVQQQAITTTLPNGLTRVRRQFNSSTTWNRSAIPDGCTVRVKTAASAYGGGYGGERPKVGNVSDGLGGLGGVGGGYAYGEWDPDTVGASVNLVVGLGGAGATSNGTKGAAGGVSKFGTLLETVPGVGTIPSPQGYLRAESAPGRGGDGGQTISGDTSYVANAGTDGQPSAKAAGGAAGTSGAGSNGADAPADALATSGGGGGGGGFSSSSSSQAGRGGNGGFPGGGGAGGGGNGGNGSTGNGGNGGNGTVITDEFFK